MKHVGIIVSSLLVVTIAAIFAVAWVGKNDYEISLRENIIAQQEVCESNFDKMFKTISQVAQVPDQFMEKSKEAFKEIYEPLIEGRYQDKSGKQQDMMMKWVTESNPQFEMSAAAPLYAKIQTVIEVNREEFFNQQKKLISLHRQHSVFCKTALNRYLFRMHDRLIPKCNEPGVEDGEYCMQIIKSLNTDNVYQSGQENDIELF